MDEPICLSRAALGSILEHLVRLEEGKHELLQEYFPAPSLERTAAVQLIEGYLVGIEKILKATVLCEEARSNFPYVVIGSLVSLTEDGCRDRFVRRLVGPHQPAIGFDDVSFLSPLGQALLLRKKGDEITCRTAQGVRRYLICEVALAAMTATR